MKALTIWQPWASMIVHGWKPDEFRNWPAPPSIVGQRIVIHAAARPIRSGELRDIMDYACSPEGQFDRIDPACMDLLERVWLEREALPFAAGLGTATLGKPRATSSRDPEGRDRYAWPMLDIERWDAPVPAKGAQGFWEWRS